MTDERLMRSAAQGDEGALEELIRALAPEVYRYLAGMLGSLEDADEALGETFVRVARSVERFDHRQSVESWVLTIARRVATDVRPTPAAAPDGPPGAGEDAVEWARRALRSLPAGDREVLVTRDVLGWDKSKIATWLSLEPEEIPARLASARSAMLGRTDVLPHDAPRQP